VRCFLRPPQIWQLCVRVQEHGEILALAHTPQVPYKGIMIEMKLDALRSRLQELGSVVVCYSGGLDSGLLLAVAHEQLGHRAVGLTAVGPALAPSEMEDARAFAREIGANHMMLDAREIDVADYVANGDEAAVLSRTAWTILKGELG